MGMDEVTRLDPAGSGDLLYACPVPRRIIPVLLLALAAVVAACGGTATASFDPTGPCTVDGAIPGAYPELEARIPTTFEGQGPVTLDSGRNCSEANLANLLDAGITEVRYAGGTWDFGGNRAAALVVFSAPGLTADLVAEFYATTARAASRTEITGESQSGPGRPAGPAHRLHDRESHADGRRLAGQRR